jgi:PAS domain S-box-containing protein
MYRILYVDDEAGLLDIGKAFLERSGDLRVDTALSALDVGKMMRESPYDAIISDYQMPDMNGIDLLKHVRAVDTGIPFILFTGKGREEVVIEALNNGVTFYVQKGGDPRSQFMELEHKVKKAVIGHRNELDLRRSEERFRSLIEDAPVAIMMVQEGLVSYANRRHLVMFGYDDADDVRDRPMEDMIQRSIPPQVPDPIVRHVQRQARRPLTEYIGVRKNGTRFPVHVAFSQVNLSDGKGVLAYVTDMTGHVRSEDALRRSESKFRAIFNEAAVGIAIADRNGVPKEFNDELVRFLGHSRSELSQLSLFDLAHPDDLEVGMDLREEYLAGRRSTYEVEKRYIRKDGQIVWGQVTVASLEDAEENEPQDIILFRDITERKKVEDELRATMAHLSMAMDMADIASWEYDVSTKTYTFNDRFYKLYATDAQREGGYHMLAETYIREFVHPDDLPRVRESFRTKTYSHSFNDDYRELEHRIVRRDGEVRHILICAYSFRDPKGARIRDFGVNQDITRYKQAEVRYLKARQKLDLLGSITRHDIKNQLQIQSANLELAMERFGDPFVLERLKKVEQSIQNVSRQIDFTKDYEMMGSMVPQWQSMEEIVKELPKLDGNGAIEIGPGLRNLSILADPMLTMVFRNLVDNSIKYSGRTDSLRIVLDARMQGGDVLLTFQDNGAGLSREDRERLFMKGFGKGTGLGLFLSKEILAITGILIQEVGEDGKGATFQLTIPRGSYRYT